MTNFRELCAELLAWADKTSAHYYQPPDVLIRARAALAEPQPAADVEVVSMISTLACAAEYGFDDRVTAAQTLRRAADLLERLTDGPTVQSREPASVAEQPSDEELHDLWLELYAYHEGPTSGDVAEIARAVLARWGNLLKEGETAVEIEATNPWKDAVFDALICAFLLNEENASDPKKALRDLLAWESELARDPLVNPPPQPIPVSERLPEAGDCDAEGRCWFNAYDHNWLLEDRTYGSNAARSHWLPAHALPLPSGEAE